MLYNVTLPIARHFPSRSIFDAIKKANLFFLKKPSILNVLSSSILGLMFKKNFAKSLGGLTF